MARTTESWKRKVDALIRLAEDQQGKPEGDLAREKLMGILRKHPEVIEYKPLRDLAWRDITMSDFVKAKRGGVNVHGSWTGNSFEDAIQKMCMDLARRMAKDLDREFLGDLDSPYEEYEEDYE